MTIDMFFEPEEERRVDPPFQGDERTLLLAFLKWYRDTLDAKCSGLDPEQLARRAVEPSSMSLLGLVRHMADVERSWFRRVMAGEDAPPLFYSKDDIDGDFDNAVADPNVVAEAWERWREEMANADRFVAGAPDLDVVSLRESDPDRVSLRWVLIHMVEEYARHCGHADLLRERIDGRVGQ
jgi:uncharacterized damage-inducible protein DinB